MNLLHPLIACATCFSDPTTAVGQARNLAVLFMGGMLALVFSVLFYVIYSFSKKQRLAAAAEAAAKSDS
ncbi:MAG: hypothetical protein KDK97_00745 [Verrucomicrobiales bacterium]|nr:hypothetical protein [Verrucomicrobiales bacterium]MCP5557872.1 hypothetical protein [Verrucomicrobiaceae bacterium]